MLPVGNGYLASSFDAKSVVWSYGTVKLCQIRVEYYHKVPSVLERETNPRLTHKSALECH